MAGEAFERQETGFVDAINQTFGQLGSIFTVSGTGGNVRLTNVNGARKLEGRLPNGSEPYTDVIISRRGGNDFKISMKGPSAPSIAGGGLQGLEEIVPTLSGKFLNAALKYYLKEDYKEGDLIPDVYGKVGDKLKRTIVSGTRALGGPIDYLYIGPMNVTATMQGNTLKFNGRLVPANSFADRNDIYLRLRKRRADQPFVPTQKDKRGLPAILGRSPSRGDTGRRIVTVTTPPSNATIVSFDS